MSVLETVLMSAAIGAAVSLTVGLGPYLPLFVLDAWRSWRAGPQRPARELVDEHAANYVAGLAAGLRGAKR